MNKVRQCYMCNLYFEKESKWSPDGHINIERLHCSKRCFRMYKVAYMSDNAFRIEHSIRRAREEMSSADDDRQKELIKWIRALEIRLKAIKRTRKINRHCRSLSALNRSSGDDRS